VRRTDLAREARVWRWGFLAAAGLCAAALLANAVFAEISPGNAWSLAYGVAAAVLLAGTGLYGVRRRAPRGATRRGLGRARAWLWLHVYGGLLFILLVLMHSGFRWPDGALTGWLWGLSAWTVLSGLAGLAGQRWIPRVLTSGLSIEVNYDRIPELVDDIRRQAAATAAASSVAVRELFRKKIAPSLDRPRRRLIYFVDITGGIRSRLRDLDYLAGFLEGDDKQRLQKLERLLRSKLEIDAHTTLQQALRLWLWLHLPPAILLAVLVMVHIFTVTYY